jgi:hypothetical protein
MRTNRIAPAVAALALAACEAKDGEAPWLTMPTEEQHAASYFPATPGSMHGTYTCDDCHSDPNTFRVFDCLHCHDGGHTDEAAVAAVHTGVAGFQWTSAACLGCHRDGIGVDHGPIFPIAAGTAHASAACAQCHVQPGDRSVLGCAGCHPHAQATVASQHASVTGYAFDSARCVRCHADAQVDRRADHGPFRITSGKHTGTPGGDCLRCHPGLRADKPFGADFAVFTCEDCHDRAEVDRDHAGRRDYAYTTEACHRCHPDGNN